MKRDDWKRAGWTELGGILVHTDGLGKAASPFLNPVPVSSEGKPCTSAFAHMLHHHDVSTPLTEYKFHPTRKWRFDYAWPESKLALEVDGGIWTQGRHTRGQGRLNDMEKFNAAAVLGWRILYVIPEKLLTLGTTEMIRNALK